MVVSSDDADIVTGNSLPISSIPAGTLIHNIELKRAGWSAARSQRGTAYGKGR